jgi:hypothetical protein
MTAPVEFVTAAQLPPLHPTDRALRDPDHDMEDQP